MATIEKQSVRAEIEIGSTKISTPDVLSFNVTRSRGQSYATFTAAVKVSYKLLDTGKFLAENVVIKAGADGLMNTIFTGKIYKCIVNPLRTDASKVILNISGKDILAVIEGQKVNRRLKTYKDGDGPIERWGVINSVIKQNAPQIQKFKNKVFKPDPVVTLGNTNKYDVETPVLYANTAGNRARIAADAVEKQSNISAAKDSAATAAAKAASEAAAKAA